jgi:hypothetical protein
VAAQIMPDMKQLAAATEKMLATRLDPPPSRAQVEALIVAVWSMAIGYIAGNAFFWRAFGRTPGPRRDRELRDAVGTMTRAMFGG